MSRKTIFAGKINSVILYAWKENGITWYKAKLANQQFNNGKEE